MCACGIEIPIFLCLLFLRQNILKNYEIVIFVRNTCHILVYFLSQYVSG